MSTEPREPQDTWQTRLVQNVELDLHQVVASKEHVHWSGLEGDGALDGDQVAIQGLTRNGSQQTLTAQSQLSVHLPSDDAGVGSRLDQSDQLMRAPRQEKTDKQKGLQRIWEIKRTDSPVTPALLVILPFYWAG